MTLGRDFGAIALARFEGRLSPVTITAKTPGAYNPADPAGAPAMTEVEVETEGVSFRYKQETIDGTRVLVGDYLIVVPRAALAVLGRLPQAHDAVTSVPPGSETATAGRVISVPLVTEAQVTLQVRGEPA